MMTHDRESEDERLERAEEVRAYLEARTAVDPESGCWLWTQKGRDGKYGKGTYRGYTWRAHRLSFHYLVDYLHRKVPVHHKCGEPLCCNPQHLQRTTWEDNTAEMWARQNLLEEMQALRDEIDRLKRLLEATDPNEEGATHE
jgi:hypothetical protein